MSLARAITSGDLAELPSRRDEGWRWTDLRGLLREMPPAAPPRRHAFGAGPFAALAERTLEVVNGEGPTSILLAADRRETLTVRFVSAGEGASVAGLTIALEPGARLTLLESHESDAASVVETSLKITIAPGARLERIVLADQGEETLSVVDAQVRLGAGGAYAQTILTNGAKRQRLETSLRHLGDHAEARLDGAYLVSGRRHADITTLVVHERPDGVTDQLVKGVAAERGKGVFQGRVEVSPGADRTDARMGHHALVLSDHAEVDAKPELEIYADDVACSHGNSVGALDEEVLFYARQRGIPEAEARAMLTLAFVGAAIARIEHEGARAVAEAWAAAEAARLT